MLRGRTTAEYTAMALVRATNYACQWNLPLDRAISYAVKVLRDGGVETFESCEGGPGHAFPEPTIRFHGGPEAGFLALACAQRNNLPVAELRRFWQIVQDEPQGPYWEMTFQPVEALMAIQDAAEAEGLIA
jgi:hypothetical protein